MIRLAAVGDVHVSTDSVGMLEPAFTDIAQHAEVLLLAGDLTKCGTADEALVLAGELRHVSVPVVAVLGNHDHHGDAVSEVVTTLRDAGMTVLEGDATVVDLASGRLGVAGTKGFGGGFGGGSATAFGEPEMKSFVRYSEKLAGGLERALVGLHGASCDAVVALLHYAPVPETLGDEPRELFPFLGSQRLAEAVDAAGASLVLHGHAHRGREQGRTPGGIAVRNVALPVLGRAYAIYEV